MNVRMTAHQVPVVMHILPVTCWEPQSKHLCSQVIGECKSQKAVMLAVARMSDNHGFCRRAAGPAGASAAAARSAAGRRRRARQALGRALRSGRGCAALPGTPKRARMPAMNTYQEP